MSVWPEAAWIVNKITDGMNLEEARNDINEHYNRMIIVAPYPPPSGTNQISDTVNVRSDCESVPYNYSYTLTPSNESFWFILSDNNGGMA